MTNKLAHLVGTRIKSRVPFCNVPQGTEGIIDEVYSNGVLGEERLGVMVAWNLPDRPLPAHYRAFDGVPACRSNILRDGFAEDELVYLEMLK